LWKSGQSDRWPRDWPGDEIGYSEGAAEITLGKGGTVMAKETKTKKAEETKKGKKVEIKCF
jgi:hypothetical protein